MHLPKIRVAQQFVRRANLPTLTGVLDRILSSVTPLRLRVLEVGKSATTLHWLLEPTPDLQVLHERLMDAAKRVGEPAGAAEAFYAGEEPARESDVKWIAEYRARASYGNFLPHITLGVGVEAEPVEPFEFTTNRVALCQLGRFCTCRVLLREWTLGAAS